MAYLAERKKRRFCYVCGTQDAANEHVAAIETLLGKIGGDLAEVATNVQGHSRGWKANRKQTASGFTLLGIGLDTIMRGIKIDELVPDVIVLDDVDGRHDTLSSTKKKIEIITETILPAGTPDCAVFFVQNLITPDGIAARLADGRADFLLDRTTDGPHRAIEGIQTELKFIEELGRVVPWITGGRAIWAVQSIAVCQQYIIQNGWRSFDREQQNNVREVEGALLSREVINQTRVEPKDVPELTRVAVGVDPASTSKNTSNETGLVGCGRTADRHGYVLESASGRLKPSAWGRRAVLTLDRLRAEHDAPGVIAAETNQGGEMVLDVVQNAAEKLTTRGLSAEEMRYVGQKALAQFYQKGDDGADGSISKWCRKSKAVRVKDNHASKSKRARAEPVAQLYDERAIHHVGAHEALEDEWCTWNAEEGGESPNLVDAEVWAMVELKVVRLAQEATPAAFSRKIDRASDSLLDAYQRFG